MASLVIAIAESFAFDFGDFSDIQGSLTLVLWGYQLVELLHLRDGQL